MLIYNCYYNCEKYKPSLYRGGRGPDIGVSGWLLVSRVTVGLTVVVVIPHSSRRVRRLQSQAPQCRHDVLNVLILGANLVSRLSMTRTHRCDLL